jgi:hypothetical protein
MTSIFEEIFNSSSLSNYLLTPTASATVFAVNDAFLQVSTLRREDMLGRILFKIFRHNEHDPDDTGVEALRRSILRVI